MSKYCVRGKVLKKKIINITNRKVKKLVVNLDKINLIKILFIVCNDFR